jgi:Tfp pilus assembly protein PilF
VARAQQLNPNDPNLADTEAAIHTHGFDPAKTVEYASGMVQKNPRDDRAFFLLAYGQWKGNDRNNAVQNLKKAIALNPNRQDYKDVMAAITQPNATADAFKGSMSIAVSNDDFNP